jgi:hypothetical protein
VDVLLKLVTLAAKILAIITVMFQTINVFQKRKIRKNAKITMNANPEIVNKKICSKKDVLPSLF